MTDTILSAVESWTGTRPVSCPWSAFMDPFVARVLVAYRWFDKGQLSTFDDEPSNRLVEGVALYHRTINAVEVKRMRREREEREANARAERAAQEAIRHGR